MEANKISYTKTLLLLEQWGKWSKTNNGYCLGYPSSTTYRKLLGSTIPSLLIEDDEARKIDHLVMRLKNRHPRIGEAIIMYYLGSRNISKVANKMKTNRNKVDSLLKSGEAWIDAALTLEG